MLNLCHHYNICCHSWWHGRVQTGWNGPDNHWSASENQRHILPITHESSCKFVMCQRDRPSAHRSLETISFLGRETSKLILPDFQSQTDNSCLTKIWRNPNLVWHGILYSCTHMATVGIKGLKVYQWVYQIKVIMLMNGSHITVSITDNTTNECCKCHHVRVDIFNI